MKVLIVSDIHLLSDSSIKWLKQQAKTIQKTKSISLSESLYEIAVQQGFLNWKHLIDTFKYEASSRLKYRVISNYLLTYEPIRKEAYNLYISRINSAIQNGDYDPIKPIENFFTEGEPIPANGELSYQSKIWEAASLEIAQKHGFNSWDELKLAHVKQEILSEYTDEQKIGAICRSIGIDPKTIQNSIFVTIEDSEDVFGIDIDEWESLGFYEDFAFVKWLENNDPYFKELGFGGQIFRMLSIDTNSHEKAEKHFNKIAKKLAKKNGFFFPIFTSFIWINGAIDPHSIEVDPEYPNDILPLSTVPDEAWKRGY
jgi:hypothetical protein